MKLSKSYNLAVLYPKVAAEWHPTKNGNLTPVDVHPKSGKKRWWLCPCCGREWEATVANRTANGSGCPNRRCNKATEHWLYRAWGRRWLVFGQPVLLYIGITDNPTRRTRQHKTKSWWEKVEDVNLEPLGMISESRARELEREAIEREQPRYNCHHNKTRKRTRWSTSLKNFPHWMRGFFFRPSFERY